MNQSSRIDRKAVHEVSPIRIVLAVIALFTLFKLNAQPENWEIRNYTTVDGLSSNDVRVVVKDHQGFLWMGAGNGLNRFDGQSFTRLVRADGSLHPISTAKILDLLVDRDGVLWAGTIRGMYRYDPTLPVDSIRHYTYFGQESAGKLYSKQPVNAITEDSAGFLWMICLDFTDWTNFGLRRFNKKRGEFEHLRIDSTFNQGEVSQVDAFVMWTYTDSKGETWLGTSSGLCRYDRDLHAFHTYVPFPGDSYKRHNGIGFCYEDQNGNFWVSSMYGIFLFDRENHEFGEMFKLDEWPILGGTSSSISAMSEDASGNLWMMLNYTLSRSPPVTGDRMNADLLEALNATGEIYITHTKLNGIYTLRMVIGQTEVKPSHVEKAWKKIIGTVPIIQ